MRLNPQELVGLDDSSIGALIRNGLLGDGIDIAELMEELSEVEKAELLGVQSSESGAYGMDYLQCPSCSTLVMFAKGTTPPTKCSKCGGEVSSNPGVHTSNTPGQQIIFNINSGPATGLQSSQGTQDGAGEHSDGSELLQFGETLTIKDVPIFAVGTHNGKAYTEADLDLMVTNSKTLKGQVIPPLKLGHKGQKIIKTQGMPAAGWMEGLRREGKLLLATFKQVPKRIAQLIKDGAWKRPSAEIYKNFKDSAGKQYGLVVAAVALLGADPPAVKGLPAWDSLPEIEKLYNSSLDANDLIVVELEFNEGEIQITDGQEGSEDSVSAGTSIEDRMKTMETTLATQKTEHDTQMATMQLEVDAAQASARKSSMEAFLEKAKKDGKLTPAVEKKVLRLAEILATASPDKYSEKGDDGTDVEKEQPALDLFKEIVEALPAVVNFGEESTGDGTREGVGTVVKVDGEEFTTKKKSTEVVTEKEVHEKILKLCEEKGWDPEDDEMYGEAYILLSEDDPATG